MGIGAAASVSAGSGFVDKFAGCMDFLLRFKVPGVQAGQHTRAGIGEVFVGVEGRFPGMDGPFGAGADM